MAGKKTGIAAVRVFAVCLFWILLVVGVGSSPPSYAVSDHPPSMPIIGTATGGDASFRPAGISLYDKSIRAGLLYDVSAGMVVWEKKRSQSFPIASLTKMMVALLAMEDVSDGKVSLDTLVRVTPEAARMTGSKVYLRTGCCLSVEELLKAALISSGNDAAYLLAQFLGGTEADFVARMNQRAVQLGMKDTVYSNSTGMPAPQSFNDNHSSPEDLLVLSLEMLKYEDLLEIAGMSDAVITQDERAIKLRNHNGLVAVYEEVDGFKTGFTQNAKYCLVATANKDDRRLISITLGAASRGVRNQFTANAISRYYEALGMGSLAPKSGIAVARNNPGNSAASKPGAPEYYKVRKGDTLYDIARKYKCGVSDLKAWNQIRGNRIDPGQMLAIQRSAASPKRPAVKNADEGAVRFYTVLSGDTLWEIAKKFEGVTVKDIMKVNRIKRAKALKPGTTLKIVMNV